MDAKDKKTALKILKNNITGYRGSIKQVDALKAMEQYHHHRLSEEKSGYHDVEEFYKEDESEKKGEITRTYQMVCPSCNGARQINNPTFNPNVTGDLMIIDCPACYGTGMVTVTEQSTHHPVREIGEEEIEAILVEADVIAFEADIETTYTEKRKWTTKAIAALQKPKTEK